MEIYDQGYGIQQANWIVNETKAAGFSRIYYLKSGDVFYQDKTMSQKLVCGKLYIFPSYSSYKITHNPKNPIYCFWVHIDLFPSIIKTLIEVDVDENAILFHMLEAMKLCVYDNNKEYHYFHTLVKAFIEYCYQNKIISKTEDQFSNIISYIRSNYSKPITIDEISNHFNYTPEHLIRIFQSKLNITPYQYILHCRMNEASKLLMQNVSVKEIAQCVGYRDSKTFSHAFRMKFGVPPTKFKDYYVPMP
ncbi:helix-turn-helix transcriptional regulator [Paludicola sp. MB14-C6]|uniref:helix-turn-helix transcriptional regulator n=1 Tax=Paludihabitans sp. MB14-C6 TaxID=3070656 RepID=UPI0027DE8BA2|nr:response regulator transcription factor [Paludicola sp. MB14-C6]WMJ22835.1 helix-turn-helix transcriptional regulator [Paludicola sp. MB14-C6]